MLKFLPLFPLILGTGLCSSWIWHLEWDMRGPEFTRVYLLICGVIVVYQMIVRIFGDLNIPVRITSAFSILILGAARVISGHAVGMRQFENLYVMTAISLVLIALQLGYHADDSSWGGGCGGGGGSGSGGGCGGCGGG